MARGMKLSPEARAEFLQSCQEVAREHGGECLATEYVNATTKLPWRCAMGHEWTAIPRNVRHFSWCPACYNERRGRAGR